MLHKYSELDIYEDFINGNLEPRKLKGSHLRYITKYLNQELEECQDMILGKFKKEGRKKMLIEKIKISSAHPLADEYFCDELKLFDIESLLPSDIYEQLDIDSEITSEQIIMRKQDSFSVIGITIESDWEELESNRLKYCYTNLVLQEHKRKIKIKLRNDFFNTNKEEAKSSVATVQSILNSYLNDVLDQYNLKESDLKIKVKKTYTNKDCAALIYLSIIDLHNFIYSHFYDLMDKKQTVPFYASVVNENSFVSSAKKILKLLKNVEMDKILYSYIDDKLEKVLNLNVNSRITYKELSYFNQFLRSFARYMEKSKFYLITEDQIIHFLLAHNFNDYLFCEFLEKRIRTDLTDNHDIQEMKMVLIRKKTEYKQINVCSEQKLYPQAKSILLLLLNWIENELEYINSLEKTENRDILLPPNQIQLNTTMKVSELAYLFKFLHDKNKIQANSINDLAKWIQISFKTSKNKTISIQNLKNNIYNPSSGAIESMKELGINLMNESKIK